VIADADCHVQKDPALTHPPIQLDDIASVPSSNTSEVAARVPVRKDKMTLTLEEMWSELEDTCRPELESRHRVEPEKTHDTVYDTKGLGEVEEIAI
jgi:hypothetical protein